jgi:hypothetical protein
MVLALISFGCIIKTGYLSLSGTNFVIGDTKNVIAISSDTFDTRQ